ncbi:MAG: elongation factor Ts [Actinomycetia bacterium]|nr:elongation factor Ts [Actinomycetes bacterium]
MKIEIDKIKELREITGLGVIDCKKALEQANGDIKDAKIILKKKGMKIAEKKSSRPTKEGVIDSYIHYNNKLGALVEVSCETDFVSKNEQFLEFVHDIAMHIAATNPLFIDRDKISKRFINDKKKIFIKEAIEEGKSKEIAKKIAEKKMEEFYKNKCLLEQNFIKNEEITIKELINNTIARIGENIKINRFMRFSFGED